MEAEKKRFLADWNPFEKIYLFGSFAVLTFCFLYFQSGWLNYLYSLSFTLSAILLAKARVETYIFNILGSVLYIMISYQQHYYGEIIICVLFSIPMAIVALANWLKNLGQDKHTVVARKVTTREVLLATASQFIMMFLYYAILRHFHTENIYLGVLSIMLSVLAAYWEIRISIWCLITYMINDLVVTVMWLMPVLQGDLTLINVLLTSVVLLISDVYGVANWYRKLHELKTSRQ
jgi:nicotinamide mononucleotide transporter